VRRILRLTSQGGRVDARDHAIAHAHDTIAADGDDVIADAALPEDRDRSRTGP
jgi:hypothetical protein